MHTLGLRVSSANYVRRLTSRPGGGGGLDSAIIGANRVNAYGGVVSLNDWLCTDSFEHVELIVSKERLQSNHSWVNVALK